VWVLDWSSKRPAPAEVARVASGCVRYLGDGRFAPAFNLTRHERDALHAAGLPIALVWEREANRMDGGSGVGERDARVVNEQADALDWPYDRPIYFACDSRDGGTPAHVAYVEGARNVSPRPIGVYGPGALCNQLTVRFKWAVRTWPGFDPGAGYCLVQEPNIPTPIPETDVNTATGDWGGWLPQGGPRVPTGADLLASAYRFRGEPYSTAPGRTSETSGYKDCSGLIVAALSGVGIVAGGTVSTSLETWAIAAGGRYLSRQEAVKTPAAGCAIWGYGSRGHIGFSVGDGRCFETPSGEGHQAGFSRFDRNRWEEFFTWPGIDHFGTTTRPQAKGNDVIYSCVTGALAGRDWSGDGRCLLELDDKQLLQALANNPVHVDLDTEQMKFVITSYGLSL
jgi:hypothetical protein